MSGHPTSPRNDSNEGTKVKSISLREPRISTDTPPIQKLAVSASSGARRNATARSPLIPAPFESPRPAHEPTLLQSPIGVQPPKLKLLPPLSVLQCPRTASSGRRLIVVNLGGSYFFLPAAWSNSGFIQPHPLWFVSDHRNFRICLPTRSHCSELARSAVAPPNSPRRLHYLQSAAPIPARLHAQFHRRRIHIRHALESQPR